MLNYFMMFKFCPGGDEICEKPEIFSSVFLLFMVLLLGSCLWCFVLFGGEWVEG